MDGWQDNIKKIVGELCYAEYRRANVLPNGRLRKHHVPYTVPELAQAMVKALDKDDEYEAKRLLVIYYTGALSLI